MVVDLGHAARGRCGQRTDTARGHPPTRAGVPSRGGGGGAPSGEPNRVADRDVAVADHARVPAADAEFRCAVGRIAFDY